MNDKMRLGIMSYVFDRDAMQKSIGKSFRYFDKLGDNDELLADCRKRRKAAILRVSQMVRDEPTTKT